MAYKARTADYINFYKPTKVDGNRVTCAVISIEKKGTIIRTDYSTNDFAQEFLNGMVKVDDSSFNVLEAHILEMWRGE